MTTLQTEIDHLDGIVFFRGERATLYPDDTRNADAVKLAEDLKKGLVDIDDALADEFWAVSPSEEGEDDRDRKVSEGWSEYRKGLGFRNFPTNAADYVRDMIDLAKSVDL